MKLVYSVVFSLAWISLSYPLAAAVNTGAENDSRVKTAVKAAILDSSNATESVKPARIFAEDCAKSLARVNRAFERVTDTTNRTLKMQTRAKQLSTDNTNKKSHDNAVEAVDTLLHKAVETAFVVGIFLRNNVTTICRSATTSYENAQAGAVSALNSAHETKKYAERFSATVDDKERQEVMLLTESAALLTKKRKESVVSETAGTEKMVKSALVVAIKAEEVVAKVEKSLFETDQLLRQMELKMNGGRSAMRSEQKMARNDSSGKCSWNPVVILSVLLTVVFAFC